jgi:hypothetical protein
MPGSRASVFGEAEDFEAALSADGVTTLLVTGHGQFRARLTQVDLEQLRLTAIEESQPRIAFVTVPAGTILVSFPIEEGPSPVWGAPCGAGMADREPAPRDGIVGRSRRHEGRQNDARTLFEQLLELRNDVGLLAEEYDPRARRQVGNYPQAFSHVALISTAHDLTRAYGPGSIGRKATRPSGATPTPPSGSHDHSADRSGYRARDQSGCR